MNMLFYGGVFLFIAGNMFSFMLDGVSGIAATRLTAAISPTDQYIPVVSASDFPSSDVRVFIEDEEVQYTDIITSGSCGSFATPCLDTGASAAGRGFNTTAAAHAQGTKVLSETLGLANQVVGFRVAEVEGVMGKLLFPIQMGFAVIKFLGKMVMWDYSFLTGNAVWIKIILLYPLSFVFVIALINLARSAMQSLFLR